MAVAKMLVLRRWCNNGDGATMGSGKVGATMALAQRWEWQHCWCIVGSMVAAAMTLVLPRQRSDGDGVMMALAK